MSETENTEQKNYICFFEPSVPMPTSLKKNIPYKNIWRWTENTFEVKIRKGEILIECAYGSLLNIC